VKYLGIFLLIVSNTVCAAWKEEVIEDHVDFNINYNSTVTVNGSPHIFHKGRYLYHSYLDNGVWKREKVDHGLKFAVNGFPYDSGYIAASVGPGNIIHVVYLSSEKTLKYAFGNRGNWTVSDTPLLVGRGGNGVGDIKVDSTGMLHVMYVSEDSTLTDDSRDFLEHATFDGVNWIRNKLDDSITPTCPSTSCETVSLEIDANDDLHVLYASEAYGVGGDLYYQVYSNGVWVKSTVVNTIYGVDYFDKIELLLEPSGNPKACYRYTLNNLTQFLCATIINGSWITNEIIIDNGAFDQCAIRPNSFKINSAGDIIGVRTCSLNTKRYLQYITYSNSAWSALDSSEYLNANSIFILESSGNTDHVFTFTSILGYGAGNAEYLTAYSYNTTISTSTVSTRDSHDFQFGKYPNIEFDSSGKLHATHITNGLTNSRYSTNVSSTWSGINWDFLNGPSRKLPFYIANDNTAHLFYYDSSNFATKYLYTDNTGLTEDLNYFPFSMYTDQIPAIQVDASGDAHMVYLDIDTWSIIYATNKSGVWLTKLIYTLNYSDYEKSRYSGSILFDNISYALDYRFDDNDRLHVALVEWHTDNNIFYSDLIYISGIDDTWSSAILEKSAYNHVWKDPSIEIDSSNNVHLVYAVNHCPDFCYPAGIVYGTNKSGIWKNKRISVESHFADDPSTVVVGDVWVTGQVADLAINDQDDVFIAYLHGAPDTSSVSAPPVTSEIRAVKIDECMPVSRIVYEDIRVDIGNNYILSLKGHFDANIDSQGKGAIAFYDKTHAEPHILIEQSGLNVKSCVMSDNTFKIEVTNAKANSLQLTDVLTLFFNNGQYNIIQNNCSNSFLASGATCFIEVQANLPIIISDGQVDHLNNDDSTFYLGIEYAENGQANIDSENTVFVIDTNEIRPQNPVVAPTPTPTSGSGGGAIVYLLLLFLVSFSRKNNQRVRLD